jgi:hypothetical protein
MKKYLIGFIFIASFAQYTVGQQIVDDGKVTRREFRLKSKQMPPKERVKRLEDWKYERFIARQDAKRKRDKKKTYAKINKGGAMPAFLNKRHKPQRANNKGWFARSDPKKHEKKTKYP